MVVSAGDPRENLEKFMKIGEGSTGTVCIATDKLTGKSIEGEYIKFKSVY
jgi:p21-activated kinase 5